MDALLENAVKLSCALKLVEIKARRLNVVEK
jgi:hypothetical protein